jgi:hypothetical protein
MLKKLIFCVAFAALGTMAHSQHGAIFPIAPSGGPSVSPNKSYFAEIDCSIGTALKAYFKRLDKNGKLGKPLWGNHIKKAAHIVSISGSPSASIKAFSADFVANDANLVNPFLVFAGDYSSGNRVVRNTSSICDRSFMIIGKDKLYVSAAMMGTTDGSAAKVASAVLTFLGSVPARGVICSPAGC